MANWGPDTVGIVTRAPVAGGRAAAGPPARQAVGAKPPRLGTTVLVAHPLGAGGLPADLEGAGFGVVAAKEADEALGALKATGAGLAVVDSRFGGDGLEFCRLVWEQAPGLPVLVTGPNEESLIARALSAGADDYLALPLRPAELVARVRAVLRRAPPRQGAYGLDEHVLQVGEVRLHPGRHEVWLGPKQVHLPLREFRLLQLLMENVGIVLPRSTIVNKLWGPGAPEGSTSLEVHIRRLRAKLEDRPSAPKRIVTVRGVGYRYQPEH